ncbi:hypothetical protein F4678DRAFT_424485 [Xylaria arbuscula]|nr:hypothetical protein F4678DRAFT_424485 [Xylaria arbuscula]
MEQPFKHPNGASPASPGPAGTSRDSPAPQKRARDYGAELKGLSPVADQASPREQSPPAVKRRKLGSRSDADGSDLESLDDGEIVESPSDSHMVPSLATEAPLGASLGSQPLNTSSVSATVPSEPGEIAVSSGTRKDLNPIQDINGEKGLGGGSRDQENQSPAISHHPQPDLPGWNHGIQLGTRTSFGVKPDVSSLPTPSAAVKTEDEDQEQQTRQEKKRVRSRDPVSSFEASNATWNFPLSAPDVVAPEDTSESDDFWVTLLKNWIVHLVQANGENVDRLTYKVVRSGWSLYFTKRMGFLQGTKKHITATRLVAQNFMSSLNKDTIETMLSDARQRPSANQPEGDITVTGSPLSSRNDEELRLQIKYFPNADDPSQHCLMCSGLGHPVRTCPELSCRFCNSTSHTHFGCPTRRRCDKCRQSGHDIDTCQERLALAADELGGCVFCGAGHEDTDCFEIWTSFRPSESNTKKVKSIPAFCYVCGGENHYGSECSLASKDSKATDRIWSKATRDIYIDPECENTAIAWAGVDLSQLPKNEFHIPGRATKKTHTYFVSSESEEDLIHAPVKQPSRRGEIRFASNIGTVNGNPSGQAGGHKSWQPSLPAGPPPPLADYDQRSLQSAPSGTLPPRPQGASGRQPGRGRGGYRGRGRGRGRGK